MGRKLILRLRKIFSWSWFIKLLKILLFPSKKNLSKIKGDQNHNSQRFARNFRVTKSSIREAHSNFDVNHNSSEQNEARLSLGRGGPSFASIRLQRRDSQPLIVAYD